MIEYGQSCGTWIGHLKCVISCGLAICHALIDCKVNKAIWDNHPGGLLLAGAPRTSFIDLFEWLMEKATRDTLVLIATAIWAIWFRRNKTIFENCSKAIVDTVASFTNMLRDYCLYASKVFSPRARSFSLPTQWVPPESNWIKINVDVHVANGVERGMGAIFRDTNGNLLAAGVRRVPATWTAPNSELAAMVFGDEIAIKLGYHYIHLEGDSTIVFKACSNISQGCSPFQLLVDRLHSKLSGFRGVRYRVVRRHGNTTAHLVARWNLGSVGETLYLYSLPHSLVTLATLDFA